MQKSDNSTESKILTITIIIILLTFIAIDFYVKSEVKKSNKLTIGNLH